MKARLSAAILCIFAHQASFADTAEKNLVFIDNSVSTDTYIPSNKERQIKQAFDLGLAAVRAKLPKCRLNGRTMVGRSDPLNILKQKAELARTTRADNTVLIGLIHSSEALLAAKSFADTEYVALSSGATANELQSVNPRFFSLANNMNRYGRVISHFLKNELTAKSVVAITPGGSYYSREFAKSVKANLPTGIEYRVIAVEPGRAPQTLKNMIQTLSKADVIFTPGFIQEALPILSALENLGIHKHVLGTPNWGRSRTDLIRFIQALKLKNKEIYIPVSWIEGESLHSANFEKEFKKRHGEVLMGTALYTYDAVVVAGSYLCSHDSVSLPSFRSFLTSGLPKSSVPPIRRYFDLTNTSLNSTISLVQFDLKSNGFITRKVYTDL